MSTERDEAADVAGDTEAIVGVTGGVSWSSWAR
jgi:hypothetical protein